MSVVKRIDVIPKKNKPALFTVFICVLNEWLDAVDSDGNRLFPILSPEYTYFNTCARVNHCTRGEICEELCVRNEDAKHTDEYCKLLAALNKPSSADKEVFDLTSATISSNEGTTSLTTSE